MKKLLFTTALLICALAIPALAQTTLTIPQLIIIEVQTAGNDSASDEFIEFYNPSLGSILLDGWTVQYKSANGSNWINKSILSGEMLGRSRLLVATDFLEASFTMAGGLAGSGGHLQLVNESDVSSDLIAWGSASLPDFMAAVPPKSGESLKRVVDEDGYFIDSNNNSADFFVSSQPSPQFDNFIADEPIPVDPDNESQPTGAPINPAPPERTIPQIYNQIAISELFIDPDKPLTDADDEFVEIFNPNKSTVDLEGYILETGSTYSYSFIMPAISIAPGDYLAIFSIDSNLTLSNTAGQARISDPNGKVLDETAAYENAKPSRSWAFVNDIWQWSEIPSPNAPNIISESESAKNAISDRSDVIGAEGSSSSSTLSSSPRNVYEEPAVASTNSLNKTILAGVGSIALLYGIYEYRHDIGNRFFQLRGNLTDRVQSGSQSSGWGSNRVGQRFRRRKDSLRSRISKGYEKLRSSR